MNERILLLLLPFWSPLVPPPGLACLKSYLQQQGFTVRTVDVNIKMDFMKLYNQYFKRLEKDIPQHKKGNFFSIGHDVLRNHMMASINKNSQGKYLELIKILIYKTFYIHADKETILQLDRLLETFYNKLKEYSLQLLEKENPTILGISVYSDSLPSSLFVFKLTREYFPNIQTIMGGGIFADHLAYGSKNLELFLEKTRQYIDKIIIGEGEILFSRWLQGALPQHQRVFTLEDIDNELLDLNKAHTPDLSDFEPENYPYMVSYTSRSCPFQCAFCSETVQWGKYRKKNARQIVHQLNRLYHTHGTQLFLLSDSLLNPVIDSLADEFLETSLSIYWDGWLRVDHQVCIPGKTWKWRQAGFYHARIGTESGSARVLNMMDKKISPGQIKTALINLALAGIKTTTLWLIGFPGETEEDFQLTLDLIEDLKNEIYEAECRPFYYYLDGQVKSSEWLRKFKRTPLYPEESKEMLMAQTWLMDCEPSREETYERINRFVAHCKKLDIPNPYSLNEIYEADQRWQMLQKNAVPYLADFKLGGKYIDENKKVKKRSTAPNIFQNTLDTEGFDF